MEQNMASKEAVEKLKELAESVKFCMFATSDTDNALYGRPMTTMQVDDNGTIWFFTSDQQKVAQDAAGGDTVCLNYADPGKSTYMTVQGTATLVKDKAR